VASDVAMRSLCDRDRVGAVIVDVNDRIIATGYNGPGQFFPHEGQGCRAWCLRAVAGDAGEALDPGYGDCPALHAEANALSVCDRREREGGRLYVNSHVCIGCAKLLTNSGLCQVHVTTFGKDAGHRAPDDSYNLLEMCGITVFVDGELY
jgi:dCMP deaminase